MTQLIRVASTRFICTHI